MTPKSHSGKLNTYTGFIHIVPKVYVLTSSGEVFETVPLREVFERGRIMEVRVWGRAGPTPTWVRRKNTYTFIGIQVLLDRVKLLAEVWRRSEDANM